MRGDGWLHESFPSTDVEMANWVKGGVGILLKRNS